MPLPQSTDAIIVMNGKSESVALRLSWSRCPENFEVDVNMIKWFPAVIIKSPSQINGGLRGV